MKSRKTEIMNSLEGAAVDGGFKLHVDRNGQIIATDLINKTKPFALRFDGGDNSENPFMDLYVKQDELIAQD
jgi:hypothetical protein